MLDHEVGEEVELAIRITLGSGVPCVPYASEELTVGKSVRQFELGALSSVRVLLGCFDLRVPPRDVRRERERRNTRFGLFHNRASVAHQAAVGSIRRTTRRPSLNRPNECS